MDPFFTEAIKIVGLYGLPMLAVIGVVYWLFKLLEERDRILRQTVESFNNTIRDHISSNTAAINLMIKGFEQWRDISSKEHERILDGQDRIIDRIK